jgi:hypothetical protein
MLTSLPTENDFDPYCGDLDAQSAWRSFGGLTLQQAYEKFCEVPEVHQEDFMFMGWKAFSFYLPVLEKYLAEVVPVDDMDDCEGWILGCAIEAQIHENDQIDDGMRSRLISLAENVIGRFEKLDLTVRTRKRVLKQWRLTRKLLERTNHST